MTIETIWKEFSDDIAKIELLHRYEKAMFKKERDHLLSQKELIANDEELKNMPLRADNMCFYDYRNVNYVFYGSSIMKIDDILRFIDIKQNRDYQFYLASAYEKFEDAIELIYAYLGKNDPDFWSLSEYGDEKYSNVNNLDMDFFIKKSKSKRGGAISIFKNIIEKLNCNISGNRLSLKTEIIMIEKIRHIIIHENGKTKDKNEFIKRIATDAGVFNNGNIDKKLTGYVELLFGKDEYENSVVLIDKSEYLSSFNRDRLTPLIDTMLFAVYVLCEKAKLYIEGQTEKVVSDGA